MVSFARKHVLRIRNAQPVRETVGRREVLQAHRAWHVPSVRHRHLIGCFSGCRTLLGVVPRYYTNFRPMVPFHNHVCRPQFMSLIAP